MAFKFIALFAFVAAASAGVYPTDYQQNYHGPALIKSVAAPVYVKKVAAYAQHEEYDSPAEYQFSYDVHDTHTGDIKSQHETRKGDAVEGQYSLIDSDGHRRIVDYTADDHHGFNAVVRREPTDVKVHAPIAKIAQYAPVAHYQQAPVAHYQQAAPIAHYAQAPVAHYAQAPVAHYAQAPVYHHAPIAKVAQYAPVAHYSAPVVAKYVQPIAKVVAPVHYAAAPVAHYSAPLAQGHYAQSHGAAQVSFSAPHHNYHY